MNIINELKSSWDEVKDAVEWSIISLIITATTFCFFHYILTWSLI